MKASVSQNITTALKSVGDLFTIGNPLDSISDMVDFVASGGDLDGNRDGVEDAGKAYQGVKSGQDLYQAGQAFQNAGSTGEFLQNGAGGMADAGVYLYAQISGSKSSTNSETNISSNVTAKEDINIKTNGDATIAGANVKAGSDLDVDVAGDLTVESKQNKSDSSTQDFAANIQYNLTSQNVSGGVNVGSGSSERRWVDDQTELTGGNSVKVNVGEKLELIGAKIANEQNGQDLGNLQVTAGEFAYSDIKDKEKDDYRSIGYSTGFNVNEDTSGNGEKDDGMGTLSATYNDSKLEGITRATIGEGTITIAGEDSDGEGVNRDIDKAQEVTFDESIELTVSVQVDVIVEGAKKTVELIGKIPNAIKEAHAQGQLDDHWQQSEASLANTIGEAQAKEATELAKRIIEEGHIPCQLSQNYKNRSFASMLRGVFIADAHAVACVIVAAPVLLGALIISGVMATQTPEERAALAQSLDVAISDAGDIIDNVGNTIGNIFDDGLDLPVDENGNPIDTGDGDIFLNDNHNDDVDNSDIPDDNKDVVIDLNGKDKIREQMGKRGWTEEDILDTVENPDRTVETKDTRHNPDTGSRNNDPATAYIDSDGNYVVVNDISGDIVQISDKNDADWQSPF